MKDLTREKAIKDLRGFIGQLTEGCQEAIKVLIPELKESEDEDERIRKDLIKYLESDRDCQPCQDVSFYDSSIAWLEKQKEQKPKVKYVYPKFRKWDVIEPITPNGSYTPVRVRTIMDGSYICRSDDDRVFLSLPLRMEEEYRLIEQKPAEWSEKDEENLNMVLDMVKYCSVVPPEDVPSSTGHLRPSEKYKKELMNWLKSLKPQPKQERSEEDEKMRKNIIWVLKSFVSQAECESNPSLSTSYPTYYKEIDWLKSLRSQPHWKPTKEQIEYLSKAILTLGEERDGKTAAVLNELRKDLKNL